jgi:hypothetical protein
MTATSNDSAEERSALVPELERELVRAARRAPRLTTSAGSTATATRAWRRSPLLAATLALLLFAAAALAAKGLLLSGSPVTLPAGTPLQRHSGLGVPIAHSAPAVAVAVADPAGGPPWGARLIATTRGYGCLQIGRVVRGELGVIGRDFAFANDARFHALPTDYLEGPFPCGPLDARGDAYAGVFIHGAPASALLGEQVCTAPGRPAHHGQPPLCPAQDERLVMAGMAGPQARSVTYADDAGQLHTAVTAGAQGIYLIVLPAPSRLGTEAGEYAPLGGAGGGTIRAVTYTDGHSCQLTVRNGPYTEQTCPPVGEQPLARPRTSTASVASPVSVKLRNERVQLGSKIVTMQMLDVSFRARVAVTGGSSQYRVLVKYPGRGRNCGGELEAPVETDIHRGQIVHEQAAENNCRGTFRVSVLYIYGGHTSGLPGQLQGTMLTVGTRSISVR